MEELLNEKHDKHQKNKLLKTCIGIPLGVAVQTSIVIIKGSALGHHGTDKTHKQQKGKAVKELKNKLRGNKSVAMLLFKSLVFILDYSSNSQIQELQE